jgi:hypothetical protein
VQKKLQEGWQIYSCYEAGASGYWLHRELARLSQLDAKVRYFLGRIGRRGA